MSRRRPQSKQRGERSTEGLRQFEELQPSDRPRFLPTFPRGLVYFRRWRTLRWFLVALIPIAVSLAAAWWRGHAWQGVGAFILGTAFTVVAFVDICSGMTSSNWGTHFRSREPIRFWIGIVIMVPIYVLATMAGWFLK